MLRTCVDMAEKITYHRHGYEFTFRYLITGAGIKCEELSILGIEDHIARPMYQCPNISIQTDHEIIRLPIFYLSQSCQGDILYAFRRTGEYKLVKVMGEWTQFEFKRSPSDSPMPPTGVWLLYNYNKRTNDRSPASVIKATGFKYEE